MAEERIERRLTAILAGDVAGYSRLMGADEEGTLKRLNARLTMRPTRCSATLGSRNSRRCGRCISTAQRPASTALANSIKTPSWRAAAQKHRAVGARLSRQTWRGRRDTANRASVGIA
jgi:hypothetical protein